MCCGSVETQVSSGGDLGMCCQWRIQVCSVCDLGYVLWSVGIQMCSGGDLGMCCQWRIQVYSV